MNKTREKDTKLGTDYKQEKRAPMWGICRELQWPDTEEVSPQLIDMGNGN